ncbi:MAG: transposase [Nitrospira sp.]|nr:transposase [Nitrospira sp.]
MKKVLQIGNEVKLKREQIKELMNLSLSDVEQDVKLQLIQDLIPLGLMHVGELLQQEVISLAGEKYCRNGQEGHVRWTKQWGHIFLGDRKVPVEYQRVRDNKNNSEAELKTYKELQNPRQFDERIFKNILVGLSCRRYEECSREIPAVFGMTSSTVSRRFIKVSKKKLTEITDRRLDRHDIVAIIIDGKVFYDDEMIVALGITVEGRKLILGYTQAGSENTSVCKEFLKGLMDRGLKVEAGVLCIVDGSKAFKKSVEEVFSGYALIQRCQWHKRENVLRYLPKSKQEMFRKKLQSAYEEPTYEDAKRALNKVKKELLLINESAVRSLEEGLEETLTLHRLGLFEELGKSLKTTNCIESLMSQIGQRTDKVDYWKNSNQKQRWVASALLDIEPRLTRVRGYKHLPALRDAIQKELKIEVLEARTAA